MTIHQVATAIRAAQGQVLLCGPTSFGYIVGAVIKGKTHSQALAVATNS